MKILEQEILYNFLNTEAFNTIQQAKAAFIRTPNTTVNFFLIIAVIALIIYGVNRSRRK